MLSRKKAIKPLSTLLIGAIDQMTTFARIKSTTGPVDERLYQQAQAKATILQAERKNIDAWENAPDNFDLGREVREYYKAAYRRDEPNKKEMKATQEEMRLFESKLKNMKTAEKIYKNTIIELLQASESHLRTGDITDAFYQGIQACITEFPKLLNMKETYFKMNQDGTEKYQKIAEEISQLESKVLDIAEEYNSMKTGNMERPSPH